MTSFLAQALPLIVFLAVDAFVDDVRWSILAAIVFSVFQLAVTWRRTRRFDWFVLLDVALIVGLGGVSIALADELFFKLKPAVVEGVTVVFFAGLLVLPRAFMVRYVERMTPGRQLTAEGIDAMRFVLGLGAAFISVHALLVVGAARWATKETWALLSGPGFYVALVPVLAITWWRGRRRA